MSCCWLGSSISIERGCLQCSFFLSFSFFVIRLRASSSNNSRLLPKDFWSDGGWVLRTIGCQVQLAVPSTSSLRLVSVKTSVQLLLEHSMVERKSSTTNGSIHSSYLINKHYRTQLREPLASESAFISSILPSSILCGLVLSRSWCYGSIGGGAVARRSLSWFLKPIQSVFAKFTKARAQKFCLSFKFQRSVGEVR